MWLIPALGIPFCFNDGGHFWFSRRKISCKSFLVLIYTPCSWCQVLWNEKHGNELTIVISAVNFTLSCGLIRFDFSNERCEFVLSVAHGSWDDNLLGSDMPFTNIFYCFWSISTSYTSASFMLLSTTSVVSTPYRSVESWSQGFTNSVMVSVVFYVSPYINHGAVLYFIFWSSEINVNSLRNQK